MYVCMYVSVACVTCVYRSCMPRFAIGRLAFWRNWIVLCCIVCRFICTYVYICITCAYAYVCACTFACACCYAARAHALDHGTRLLFSAASTCISVLVLHVYIQDLHTHSYARAHASTKHARAYCTYLHACKCMSMLKTTYIKTYMHTCIHTYIHVRETHLSEDLFLVYNAHFVLSPSSISSIPCVCMHIGTYMYKCKYLCVHVYMYGNMHMYVSMCACTHVWRYKTT